MSEYQVIARKYRPQTFAEIIGQEAIVTTLKNAIKNSRLAHAYIFCGSRGTGKTTIARVFAKALNCQQPTDDLEPCCRCSTCKEIAQGNSLDVLEIDGASHRGIEDIRRINETVAYASAAGKYKIYIIDEVHMLTKEAFNALLKTLEEPPPKVKFFFATTEPHKVLSTILSRCQRFNLQRIATEQIVKKLRQIAEELKVSVTEEALLVLAKNANGGLRDAESLFDQIIAFHSGEVTQNTVTTVFGLTSKESLFELDKAGKEGNLQKAFDISHQIFSQGKDLVHFVEALTEHIRNILLIKLGGTDAALLSVSEAEKVKYASSAKMYRKDQCLTLLDYLFEVQEKIRFSPSKQIAIETILLRVIRSHQQLPVEFLVRRLCEIEEKLSGTETHQSKAMAEQHSPARQDATPKPTKQHSAPPPDSNPTTPPEKKSPPSENTTQKSSAPVRTLSKEKQSRYDTLLQFAAVELEGTVQKQHITKT